MRGTTSQWETLKLSKITIVTNNEQYHNRKHCEAPLKKSGALRPNSRICVPSISNPRRRLCMVVTCFRSSLHLDSCWNQSSLYSCNNKNNNKQLFSNETNWVTFRLCALFICLFLPRENSVFMLKIKMVLYFLFYNSFFKVFFLFPKYFQKVL